MDLQGSVALVTGGSGGLGSAIARLLGRSGVRVAVGWSRSKDAAEKLAAEIGGIAIDVDVADEGGVIAAVDAVRRSIGPIDLLVNNAGITKYAPYADLTAIDAEDWHRILGVNVIGAWSCIRAVLPGMRERGRGSIVNVASDSALTFEGSSVPYVASKTALVAMTRMLADALAPSIRVNAVAPGWMVTPWLDRYVPADRSEELRRGDEPSVPVQSVAAEVVRLLGDDATSGAVVRLDPA